MSANSTVLANLQLQIQDNLNPNTTPLNFSVPQLSLPASTTALFVVYQTVVSGGAFQVVPNGVQASVCFVRNVSNDCNLQLTYQNGNGVNVNTDILCPGGVFFLFQPSPSVATGTTSVGNMIASPVTSGKGCVFEYLWAL